MRDDRNSAPGHQARRGRSGGGAACCKSKGSVRDRIAPAGQGRCGGAEPSVAGVAAAPDQRLSRAAGEGPQDDLSPRPMERALCAAGQQGRIRPLPPDPSLRAAKNNPRPGVRAGGSGVNLLTARRRRGPLSWRHRSSDHRAYRQSRRPLPGALRLPNVQQPHR